MLSIAVLGCGRIGRMHAENIANHPRARLAGVFDVYDPAADEVSSILGATKFATAEELMTSHEVQAILIATSTPTHANFIEMAALYGKPVLCEKPIDLSLQRVNECANRIAGKNLPIMLGFVRRFDPSHRAVRQAIEAGKIGEVHQVTITSRDPGMASDAYIEASGGIFRDMTIHDFDMARFILGEEIETVYATGSRLVNEHLMERVDDHDTVTVLLTSTSGKQVTVLNSRRAAYGYDQRVEAFGSAGMAISENHTNHNVNLFSETYTYQRPALQNFFIERYKAAFSAEIDAFIEAVEKGTPPEVGFEDGRLALVLAEAALKSLKEQRPVNTAEVE